MTVDLSQLQREIPEQAPDDEYQEPDRYPVPGGFVDLIPIPATIVTEDDKFTCDRIGSWGFCPFGIFMVEAEDEQGNKEDALVPYRKVEGIVYNYDKFAADVEAQEAAEAGPPEGEESEDAGDSSSN